VHQNTSSVTDHSAGGAAVAASDAFLAHFKGLRYL